MSIQFGDAKPLDIAFVDDVLGVYNSGGLTLEKLSNIFSDYMGMAISRHDIEALSNAYNILYDGFIVRRCSSNLGSDGEDD